MNHEWFYNNENFAARATRGRVADFLELNFEKYIWLTELCNVGFQKSKKSAKSFHSTVVLGEPYGTCKPKVLQHF